MIPDRKKDDVPDLGNSGLDEIRDFNLAAGDRIDLRDVAACLNFTPEQMARALVVLAYPQGAMICAEVGGDLHKIMLVHGVTAKTMKQSAPWIFDDGDAAVAENVSLDATVLPEALYAREEEEPIDIDVTVEVSEHFHKSVDMFVFNPAAVTVDEEAPPAEQVADETDIDIEAIVKSAWPTVAEAVALLTAHNAKVDRIDVADMTKRADDANAVG